MRTLPLAVALLLGLAGCSPDWLRQYTTSDIAIDNMHVAVSWLLIDDGQRNVYDVLVTRSHPPAGTIGAIKLPATTARAAAALVMEERCKGAELYGDEALPQPRFTFRAICPRR